MGINILVDIQTIYSRILNKYRTNEVPVSSTLEKYPAGMLHQFKKYCFFEKYSFFDVILLVKRVHRKIFFELPSSQNRLVLLMYGATQEASP